MIYQIETENLPLILTALSKRWI